MPTESFFSQSSLAYIASAGAGKDGKAYSIKPADGTGDFTFSRGSNLAATRVGADGLIEKGRENLILQSNSFNSAPWSTSSSDATTGQSGYDGTNDAWLLSKTAINGRAQQNIVTSGVQTFSVYAKAGTKNWTNLLINGGPSVFFDLQNGVLGSASNYIDANIESVGNGFYRCSVTFDATISRVRIYVSDDNNNNTGTSGNIIIQDAQLEVGLTSTEYIESGATKGTAGILENTPRFDYSNGASCPSLLLEPSRTQLVRQSEYFQSSHWTKDSNTTLTTNAAISPDGSQNATRFESSSAVSGMFSYGVVGNKTISIYIKAGDTGNIGKSMRLYTTEAAGDFVLTNDWQRISLTGNASNLFALYPSAANGFTSAFIWGAQGEAASYSTSYIPNHSGGTITRAADSCSKTGISSLIGQTEGTMFVEFKPIASGVDVSISISDGTYNNSVSVGVYSNNLLGIVRKSGVFITQMRDTSTNTLVYNKMAITYNSSICNFYVNGVLIGTSAGATFTSGVLTTLGFFRGSSHDLFYGNTPTIQLYKTALSNADCITLTTI